MKSGYKETFCKEKEQLKTDLPMKWRWKWYFFPNLSSLTIDLQYIRMLSLDRQPTCEANILLQNGLRARRLIIYQMAFSHFMLFHPLLIHRNCACFSNVSLYSQLFLHGSPSAQGWPASLGADHQVQQVHDPGRTICTSLRIMWKSAAFLRNYSHQELQSANLQRGAHCWCSSGSGFLFRNSPAQL